MIPVKLELGFTLLKWLNDILKTAVGPKQKFTCLKIQYAENT